MDPIYEAYKSDINEQGPSRHFDGTNKTDQEFADLASGLYDKGMATEQRVNSAWKSMTSLFGLKPKEINKSQIKQFLADLENVEVADEDGNVIHVTAKRINQYMKNWIK